MNAILRLAAQKSLNKRQKLGDEIGVEAEKKKDQALQEKQIIKARKGVESEKKGQALQA